MTTSPAAASRSIIEAFADLWCPFAYVGLLAAQRVIEELDLPVDLVLRSWPLELVNGEPLAEAKTHANAVALRASVAPDNFAGIDQWSFPVSTLQGLQLAAQVTRQRGSLGTELSMALRIALFEEGKDIGDLSVLQSIAQRFGVPFHEGDVQLVRADLANGQAHGVKGSPHFFCGELDMFCPTLDLTRDQLGHLQVQLMMERLRDFMCSCQTS